MIMRLPSNGMLAPISFMRGSLIIFSLAASRVALSGYSNQEKTTFSSSLALTALRKSVTLPSGTSLSQASTWRVDAELLEDRRGVGGMLAIRFLVGLGHRRRQILRNRSCCFSFGCWSGGSAGRRTPASWSASARWNAGRASPRRHRRRGCGCSATRSVWRRLRSTLTIIRSPMVKRPRATPCRRARRTAASAAASNLLDDLRPALLGPVLAALKMSMLISSKIIGSTLFSAAISQAIARIAAIRVARAASARP